VFMTPADHVMLISSTLVKEIAALGGKVGDFVEPRVEAALAEKFR
jgi:pantetheine-phosphate adenylyltransferase